MAKKKETSSLVCALDFISLAQRDKGAPYQTHVNLSRNFATAYDGVLAAGHKIDEDITACPHTVTLRAALAKCEGALAVTQLDSGRLSIRSGKFKAFVACSQEAVISSTAPDPQCGVLNNAVRDALIALSPLIAENSQRVVTASALLGSMSAKATNGRVIMEYWHGIDLPPGLLVPKLFINALEKIKKKLVGFGFSQSSFTVYFEDASWLKTQLYNDVFPDFDRILNREHRPVTLPEGFAEALDNVFEFVEDNRLRVRDGVVRSSDTENCGASYEVHGLVANVMLNAKDVKLIIKHVRSIDFNGNNGITYFYGDNIRGALTQMKE